MPDREYCIDINVAKQRKGQLDFGRVRLDDPSSGQYEPVGWDALMVHELSQKRCFAP